MDPNIHPSRLGMSWYWYWCSGPGPRTSQTLAWNRSDRDPKLRIINVKSTSQVESMLFDNLKFAPPEWPGRFPQDSDDGNAQYGLAARFQQALGKRFVLQIDGFVADEEDFDSTYGARLELLFKL